MYVAVQDGHVPPGGKFKLSAGEQLKDIRNRLGITIRDVEDYSRGIAGA